MKGIAWNRRKTWLLMKKVSRLDEELTPPNSLNIDWLL